MESLVYVERYLDEDSSGFPGSRRLPSKNATRQGSATSTNDGGGFNGSQRGKRSDPWQKDLRQYSHRGGDELVYKERYCSDAVDHARSTGDANRDGLHQDIDLSFFSNIPFDDDDHCGQNDFPLIEQQLEKITRNFAKCEKCYTEFVERYPVWNGYRRKSMTQIKEIAEVLGKTKKNCNVAKMTSLTTAAAGGITAMVGAALTPYTFGASSSLVTTGFSLGAVGGSATFTAAVTEAVLERGNINAAIELLKKDKEEFQRLSKWLKHTSDFVDSIKEVMDLDVFVRLVTDFKRLASILNEQSENKSDKLSTFRDFVYNLAQNVSRRSISAFVITLAKNPKLIKMFKELVGMHHDNPVVFESTAVFARTCVQVLRCTDFGIEVMTAAVTTISEASSTTVRVSATTGRALSLGLFAGVGLAIDLLSLVLTSIDLYNGSKCPSAEKLLQAHKQLSDEFDTVKRFYSELIKCLRN